MKTTVSEKGQIAIPKSLRDRLGLRPGSIVDFEASDGVLLGRKRVSEDLLLKWRGRGHLPQGLRVDEYLRKARG
ncbi:MAG: AbrB/MazE/SpoVT family DNA-binding domain-containing protein [Verrucomicrobia bacterium]|nr:AbrB/MazE/SpoVT family DNA-binding domain-containing protein [Verrucomicrobiota bacterium]